MELGINQAFSSIEHPQINRLAEATNKIIIARLKKILEQAKGLWADELHVVLWAYHATSHSLTKETLYRLVYGLDAVIPIELTEPSSSIMAIIEKLNELTRRAKLDVAEEDRKRGGF